MQRCILFCAAILCASAFLGAQTAIPIANQGFEATAIAEGSFTTGAPPSWTAIAPAFPSSAIFCEDVSFVDYRLEAPEGENCCTLLNDAGIRQTVVAGFVPGKSYVLGYRCAKFPTFPGNRRMEVRILINGTEVLSEIRRSPTTDGIWDLQTVTYTHPSFSFPVSGFTIEIRLADGAVGGKVSIDDVELAEVDGFTGFRGDIHPIGSFENETPDSLIPLGAFNGEKFRAEPIAGLSQVRAVAAGVFPTNGGKFCEVSNVGTGPGGSAPRSALAIGTYVATNSLLFDMQMFTGESIPSGSTYNDRLLIEMYDVSSGSEVLTESTVIVETNVAGHWTGPSPTYFSNLAGTFTSATNGIVVVINFETSELGKPYIVKVVVENGGDSNVPSSVIVDNIRWSADARRPGTSEGLQMATGVDSQCVACVHYGELSSGALNDEKSIGAGDVLHVGINSLDQNFFVQPILLAGQFFSTGSAEPTPIPSFNLWVNTATQLLINGTIPNTFGNSTFVVPGGSIHSFFVPFGFSGFSMMLQTIVPSPTANNGFFATSDAHLIRFN